MISSILILFLELPFKLMLMHLTETFVRDVSLNDSFKWKFLEVLKFKVVKQQPRHSDYYPPVHIKLQQQVVCVNMLPILSFGIINGQISCHT